MRYWKRLNPDNTTQTVESYSHILDIAGATEITQAEFQAFLNSLPPPPPPIDWVALWQAANMGTIAEQIQKKLAVLAKRLGME